MSEFRNYDDCNDAVKENYKQGRIHQTYEHVVNYIHPKYLNFNQSTIKLTILEALDLLKTFVDLSDPDLELPNIVHAYQVAEQIRLDGHPDWIQLVGLIHDLGKMIYIKGRNEDGTTMTNQYSIVGDTFILGCPIPSKIVYPEFNELNLDHQRFHNQDENSEGIYSKYIGLDNCTLSFGHDEYLYRVLKHNGTTIPQAGLDMIRYHSLYVWHTYGQYRNLMNDDDYKKLEYVQLFNKYDLYTKKNVSLDDCVIDYDYYKGLIEKYITLGDIVW